MNVWVFFCYDEEITAAIGKAVYMARHTGPHDDPPTKAKPIASRCLTEATYAAAFGERAAASTRIWTPPFRHDRAECSPQPDKAERKKLLHLAEAVCNALNIEHTGSLLAPLLGGGLGMKNIDAAARWCATQLHSVDAEDDVVAEMTMRLNKHLLNKTH
jgi:hypothetical protein